MPRYHFHVRAGAKVVLDEEGSYLPDLEAARHEAVLDARSAMSDAIRDGYDLSQRTVIEICDDQGRILMLFPYTDAILPN